jgi:hypothetical protein
MKSNASTPFINKVNILAELWIDYKNDEEFVDFIEYNDMGLPLAYFIANDVVKPTVMAERFVNETFDLLLAALEIEEDTGFDSLDDLLAG